MNVPIKSLPAPVSNSSGEFTEKLKNNKEPISTRSLMEFNNTTLDRPDEHQRTLSTSDMFRERLNTSNPPFDTRGRTLSNEGKPPYSYAVLLTAAIKSSPKYSMTLNDIYEWIQKYYPFYKTCTTGILK